MGVAWVGLLPALGGAALGVVDLARPAELGAMELSALAASAPQWAPTGGGASPAEGGVSASGMGGGPALVSALTRVSLRDIAGEVSIDAEVGHALLVQEEVARRFTLAGLSAGPLLSGPAFALSAGVSTWLEGVAPKLVGGYLGVVGASASGASWSARLSHEPIWRSPVGPDPLRGLRVQDLKQLDPRLAATDLRVSGALEPSSGRRAQLQVGATAYGDGNRRIFTHAGADLPLAFHGATRIDVMPAAYAEGFTRSTRGFLTPHSFASLGAGLQVVSTLGPLTLDAVVEPHLFRYPHLSGFGVAGSMHGAIELGRSVIGLSTELLRQGPHSYVQVQLVAGLASGLTSRPLASRYRPET